jgi:rhodanese-related sulfurtransferase
MTHPRVSALDAHALVLEQGYVFLDVRSEQEFALGHPEGAYNVPLMQSGPGGLVENRAFIDVIRAAFARECKFVVGCQSGSRSRAAALLLLEAGYSDVVEQRAGYEGTRDPFGRAAEPGWRAAALPCSCDPLPGRDYAALMKRAQVGPRCSPATGD